MNQVDDALLKDILFSAGRIRWSELLIAERYPERKMRCPTHLCLGQEITAAVFGRLARPDDRFLGTYRSHGHYLAKGGDQTRLFAELLGKKQGCSGGFGGSPHIIDRSVGFHGTSAIVGAMVPIACGVAFSRRCAKAGEVTVVFFGDGAIEEGIVTESANFAALHRLPIVFVCENNRLCVTTPPELRAPNEDLATRFESYGIRGARVSSHDPIALVTAASQAMDAAREGRGPQFVEVAVDRWAVHVGHEWSGPADSWWRDPSAPEADGCAIAALSRVLLERGAISREGLVARAEELRAETARSFAAAESHEDHVAGQSVEDLVYASGALSVLPDGKWTAKDGTRVETRHDRLKNPY